MIIWKRNWGNYVTKIKIFRRRKSEEDLEGQFEEVTYIANFCLDVFDAFSEKLL